MSAHPNVILMVALTPDDLPMKTYREIMASAPNPHEYPLEDIQVTIGASNYTVKCFTEDYDEDIQISAQAGQIVVYDLVTYGWGEYVTWAHLEKQKSELASWAEDICGKHKCSMELRVSANHW